MTMDDEALDNRMKALMPGGGLRRRRGRPPLGLSKALDYTDQYWELRRSGVSPWRAVVQVALKNKKRPEHISACRKLVEETDPYEYMEPDRVDEFMRED